MRRRRGHAYRSKLARDARLRKTDNFLPSRPERSIVFQKGRLGRRATHDFGVRSSERLGNGAASHWNRSKRTRKWRQLTVGSEGASGEGRIPKRRHEVDKMEDKLGRLEAAREAPAL
jgi:hypothetical protein